MLNAAFGRLPAKENMPLFSEPLKSTKKVTVRSVCQERTVSGQRGQGSTKASAGRSREGKPEAWDVWSMRLLPKVKNFPIQHMQTDMQSNFSKKHIKGKAMLIQCGHLVIHGEPQGKLQQSPWKPEKRGWEESRTQHLVCWGTQGCPTLVMDAWGHPSKDPKAMLPPTNNILK